MSTNSTAPPSGGVAPDVLPQNTAPPAGGVAPDVLPLAPEATNEKNEEKRREERGDEMNEAKTETEEDESGDGATMSTGGSHEESVHSEPRPRMRQDTPWASDAPTAAPTNDMTAIIAMMANMQQHMQQQMQQQSAQMQQQSTQMQQQMQQQSTLLEFLARDKRAPPPAHTHAPASPSSSAGPTQDQPRLFKRPDKLVCPTLTRYTKDPFVVIRHIYALEAYVADARPSIDPEFFDHWLISQCNSSISSVGQWVSWAREEGTQYLTLAEWSEGWKEKVLDRDWVRQVRLSLSHKRMEGTNPRAFDAFSA
ncbi:hypothetical protein B9479_008368, partial [Cryptococcus floricola]